MILRKLKQEEHIKTRKLWEQIFQEDTKEFLDYYYSVKTKDNEIYVIEEDGQIVSMLHLNPYQMRIADKIYDTHYIVAVATDENYRRRGYMAALLNHAMQVMADRGEPFTFLMPAAEAIYKPFGFEFVYMQTRGSMRGKAPKQQVFICECETHKHQGITYNFATKQDCEQIAEFANQKLQEYDIVTWRDTSYYATLLEEQKSENGGILILKKQDKIEGVFCFARGERIEIREPLCANLEGLQDAVYHLTGNGTEEVTVIGCEVQGTGYDTHTKPMIMAKALQPEFEEILKKSEIFLNEVV